MITDNNKKVIILSVLLVSTTISVWYFIGDEKVQVRNTREQALVKVRQEIFRLTDELEKAKKSGKREKVKKIEKKIESQLPEKLKNLVGLIESNAFDLDFYGKVVDQHGKPVANAKISYDMTTMYKFETTAGGIVETNQFGLFNIKASGYTLSLKMPEHPKLSNKYMPGTAKLPFESGQSILLEANEHGRGVQSWKEYSRNNPYVIRAWRSEQFENILHGNTLLGLSPDNKVHTFIKTKPYSKMIAKSGIHPHGDLLINCTRDPSGLEKKNGGWEVVIKAIDGGIQETDGSYHIKAPIDGYHESLIINQNSGESFGTSVLKNKYYYYTAHNGNVYGSLTITYEPYLKKRYCGLYVDYVINKKGSRNLAVK